MCDYDENEIIGVVFISLESYPGHSILTEDDGVILEENNYPCGILGKYFKVSRRIKLKVLLL